MTQLMLNLIKTDGGTQPRSQMDFIVIGEYAEAMEGGAAFPPVVVFFDGEDYWLADGFHRLKAAVQLRRSVIEADVRQGTRRDAILFSVGANAQHGLQRGVMDKRRAVQTLLNDEEWAAWSDREIARQTQTTHPFVAKIRTEVGATAERRTYTRQGQTATMNTANIGAAPKAATGSSTPFTDTWLAAHPDIEPDPDEAAAMDQELVEAGLAEPATEEWLPEPGELVALPPVPVQPPAQPAPPPPPAAPPPPPPPVVSAPPVRIVIEIKPGGELMFRQTFISLTDGDGTPAMSATVYSRLAEILDDMLIKHFGSPPVAEAAGELAA